MEFLKALEQAGRRCWKLFTPDRSPEERKELAQSETWNAQERDRIVQLAQEQNAQMHREQDALAAKLARIEHKAVEGLGVKVGSIPYAVYMQMRVDHGEDCWSDPAFIDAFFRDNPQLRAKTKFGTRGQEYGGNGRR
jgi:hypothetical protein